MPRRLGQHFLRSNAVEGLVALIDPRPDQHFLEIGPGTGALTWPLAAKASSLTAVELDSGLAERLRETAPRHVRIVTGDALTVDLGELVRPGVRLVGNLPYYISSPLLRRLLTLRDRASDLHVMLQEEVADRVAAAPGSKAYGFLSVLFGLRAEVDVPMRLPPEAFQPPPKVRSAILRARFREHPEASVADPKAFEAFVLAAFRQRRRTLENNLQDSYPHLKRYLRLLNIDGRRRAETLSVVEFARLFATLGLRA